MPSGELYRKLLLELNPFKDNRVDNPWQPVVDVPSINGVARSGLLDIYREVEKNCQSQCAVITGTNGSGRTHLVARLADELGVKGLIVYVDSLADGQKPFLSILNHLVSSLDERRGAGGPSSMQTFACHIVATAMVKLFEHEPPWKGRPLYKQVAKSLRKREDLVAEYLNDEGLRDKVLSQVEGYLQGLDSRLDVTFLDVLLKSLSAYHSAAARAWLSGHSLGPRGKSALGTESHIAGEEGAFAGIVSLGALAATYHPLVLVFEDIGCLEAIKRIREEVPATLIVFSCEREKWSAVKDSDSAQFLCENTFVLQPLDELAISKLLACRLSAQAPEAERPWPCWPLPTGVPRELSKEGPNCRRVLDCGAAIWRELRESGLHHSREDHADDWD